MLVFRAEKRSAQASISTHPLLQAFLFVECVFLCRSVRVLTETERNIRGATGSTLISIRQTDVDRLMIRTQSKG